MRSTIDKLHPNDPRIRRQYAVVNGHRWHYLDAAPEGKQRGTVVLVHGFPDLSFGWRYQIPLLLGLGLRCIAIDCMGYGGTGTSTNLQDFTFRAHADAIAGIAAQQGISQIILGGHDWGGVTVYRVAQWYPQLVTHIFSVCTSFAAPTEKYVPTEVLAATTFPQFGYQLQFGSKDGQIEAVVKDEVTMRKFVLAMFGGRPSSRKPFMLPRKGIDLDMLKRDEFTMSPLMNEEEVDYYVQEYMRNGIRGPCNWYRTHEANWKDDKEIPAAVRKTIKQPTLFILALKDDVLTPELSKNMERDVPHLTRGEVPAAHWAMLQTPEQTNGIIKKWFEDVVFAGTSKL